MQVTYEYDANNRLSAMDLPNAGRLTYNSYQWNRPTKMTLPGGSQVTLTYDPLMRLTAQVLNSPQQQTLMNARYEYSSVDTLMKKVTEQGEYRYQYDALSRLTQATAPTLAEENYTYDALGNRLTESGVSEGGRYDANHALLRYDGAAFEYLNGNLVKKTVGDHVTHYQYGVDNRLTQVQIGEDEALAEYAYDPFGRRLWKTVQGVTTYFLYADEGLVGEYTETGEEAKGYGYLPDDFWTTDPLFQTQQGNYYWYQNDWLGTPQKL